MKKTVQARIRAERKKQYKKLSERINKLPKAQQKETRERVKKQLMKKQKQLFSRMVGSKKMSLKDLKKFVTQTIKF